LDDTTNTFIISNTFIENGYQGYEVYFDIEHPEFFGSTIDQTVICEDNKLYSIKPTTDNKGSKTLIEFEDLTWDAYKNPFLLTDIENYSYVETTTDGDIFTLDSDKTKGFIDNLTRYPCDSFSDFRLTVSEEGDIALSFVFISEFSGSTHYEFDISEVGTASIFTGVYPTKDYHEDLEIQLYSLLMTSSYTVNHLDHIIGEEDLSYSTYFTEDATYNDYYKSGCSNNQGVINRFSVVDGTPVLGEELHYYDKKNTFNYLFMPEFASELFSKESEDTYVVNSPSVAQIIAPFFAEDYENEALASFATSLSVTFKDGVLDTVLYTYEIYGILGTVTLTYTDIDETVIPVDLSHLYDGKESEIPNELKSTWIGITSYQTELDEITLGDSSVTINDVEYTYGEYGIGENYNTLELVSENQTLSAHYYPSSISGAACLEIYDEEDTQIFNGFIKMDNVTIPSTMQGNFKGNEDETLIISITENSLTFNSNPTQLIQYDYAGFLYFAYDNDIYVAYSYVSNEIETLYVQNLSCSFSATLTLQ